MIYTKGYAKVFKYRNTQECMKTNEDKVEFDAIVRERTSAIGTHGQITSKKLAGFILKRVHVTVKVIDEEKT